MRRRHGLRRGRAGLRGHVDEELQVLLAHVLQHEGLEAAGVVRSKACGWSICSATSGGMPCRRRLRSVGAMMKLVRNSASATITALDGAVLVPMAVRSSDNTTTMRVKDVTITRIDGASDRIVISATSCSARSVRPVPSGERQRVLRCAGPARTTPQPQRPEPAADGDAHRAGHGLEPPGIRPSRLAISSSRLAKGSCATGVGAWRPLDRARAMARAAPGALAKRQARLADRTWLRGGRLSTCCRAVRSPAVARHVSGPGAGRLLLESEGPGRCSGHLRAATTWASRRAGAGGRRRA